MTLEPDRRKPRFSDKKRRKEHMKNHYMRQLDILEGKRAMGEGLTGRERTQLKALKKMYKLQ